MIESSHKQESWLSLESVDRSGSGSGSGWIARLLVRWDEQQVNHPIGDGETQIEYTYQAIRMNYAIPIAITSAEEIEYYLEQAKDAILARAQALAAQEVGFDGTD